MSRLWLSIREAAALWAVSPARVEAWAREGRLRARKTRGGRWRVLASQPPLLTTGEAAAALGLSRRTVARWAAAGKIATAPRNTARNWHLIPADELWRMKTIVGD